MELRSLMWMTNRLETAMTELYIVLGILVFLSAFLIFSQNGRRNHSGLDELRRYSYAHRGLHGSGVPENSLKAFQLAKENGYGIELDVHLLKDGSLAVMHDSRLSRTTGQEGILEDLTAADLCRFPLEGTKEVIPTFQQVLDLFNGKAPIIVELKSCNGNYKVLSENTAKMLDGYQGKFCVESFDPRCVFWMRRHRPRYIRGQLAENFLQEKSEIPWVLRFISTHNLLNFITRPDFVAYNFDHRHMTPTTAIWKNLWKLQPVAWTIQTPEDYETAKQEGWIPIFENFKPETQADHNSAMQGACR